MTLEELARKKGNAPEASSEPQPIASGERKRKEAAAAALDAGRWKQENIKAAGQYRADILKGLRSGGDIYDLFLTACKCIEAMTGDTVFYEQARDDLEALDGEAIGEGRPLEWMRDKTRQRMERLHEARRKDPGNERISAAIQAHAARLDELEKRIAST